ncbi:hypothetical protein, conserved [Eimeria brunetti]|uniref:U3 small nucleolar RNA-associated protein 20 domain-containing protein n=1 Tax=Eimeria brunetti TaxID=51314 RepID=U6L767_9EIME|nr:hypothetical protein, conserved [Eimeria brunetti]
MGAPSSSGSPGGLGGPPPPADEAGAGEGAAGLGSSCGALGSSEDPSSAAFVSVSEARSGGGSKVRDEATGKYVFQTFRQQLQQQLQRGQPGSRHLSALDIMQIYNKGEARPWKRLKEGADEEEAEEARRRIETEASDFAKLVVHLSQSVEAKGPARQLLIHLSNFATSLPLLLLQQQEVLQLLLQHLRDENIYSIVLQLLPALAKDLRQEFLVYLQSCIGALHLLLFDLEGKQDADGVQKIFTCLTQIFRYLHKYLLFNMEDFLDIMLPLLLHSAPPGSSQKRKRLEADEQQEQQQQQQQKVDEQQQQEQQQQQPRQQQQQQQQADAQQHEQQGPPLKRRADEAQRKGGPQRQVHRRVRCYPQKQKKDASEVKVYGSSLMAAQAVATVLRRSARDEAAFYDCVASITEYFLYVPPSWLPVFSVAASRIFFESIRGLESAFTSSFEGTSCFLVANVLLRQRFTLPRSGATYEPPPLELKASEESANAAAGSSSSSNSNSSSKVCGRQVYLAQAECVRMYLEEARRHATSTDSPAALALQRVTLRLLAAAAHSALSGQEQHQQQQEQQQTAAGVKLQAQQAMNAQEVLCLLTSSFSPFFSFYPFRQLTSFSYFKGLDRPFPCCSTAAAPCSSCCLPPPVVVGCCTLADAAASWFSSTPRSTGSFDAYIQELLETLLPFCVSPSGAPDAVNGAPFSAAAAIEPPQQQQQQQQPPAVPPLIKPLLWNFVSNSDSGVTSAAAAAAAVAVLLPCSFLRVVVLAWRALSVSYTKAVSMAGNPFQHLLPALLNVQRHQRQQLQQQEQQPPQQQGAREWWQRAVVERVVEVFLYSLRMLLLVPAPVDGFSSLCLRSAVEFLAGQPAAWTEATDLQLKAEHRLSCSAAGGQVQQQLQQLQQLMLGDMSSSRWVTASFLLATILKTFGRTGKAVGTGSTSATIRLLLPLHLESCLRGTCAELQRLETALRNHVSSYKKEGGETTEAATAAAGLEGRLAAAFVSLQWLWELRKALPSTGGIEGKSASPVQRLRLTTGASRAAAQLQQQQQKLLSLLVEAVQHVQQDAALRGALILLCSRSFVTFLSLPRLMTSQGEENLACPGPPDHLTQLCADRLSDAAAACNAAAAATAGKCSSCCCDCFGSCRVETRMVLSAAEFEGARRLLLSSSSSSGCAAAAAETPEGEATAAASEHTPEGSWFICLLSLVLSSNSPLVSNTHQGGGNAAAAAPLQSSPALVKSLCLALRFLNCSSMPEEKPQQQQQQQQYCMRELSLVAVKVLLPNLSSGSAPLRLWSLRFISGCEPSSLLSCCRCSSFAGSSSGSSSCPMQRSISPAAAAVTAVRSLLQKLEALEQLKVDLETERQKVRLLQSCAEEVRSLQNTLAIAEANGGAAAGPQCGGLLLLLQLAYRVLLAGLSVKFAIFWPEVVEVVAECVESFQSFVPSPPKASYGISSEGSSVHAPKQQLHVLPPEKQQKNAALAFVWSLVVSETHRALDELGPSQEQQQQEETSHLQQGRHSEAAGAAANSCNDCVLGAWEAARGDEAAAEETAPLQRHSHLLRILQHFATWWGSNAFWRPKLDPRQQQKQQQKQQQQANADEDGPTERKASQQPHRSQGALMWRRNFARNALRFLLVYGHRIALQLTRSPDSRKELEASEEGAGGEMACAARGPQEPAADSSSSSCSSSSSSSRGTGGHQQQGECMALELATASLVPRAQDVLRAILAHGEMRFPRVGQRLLGLPFSEFENEKETEEEPDEVENMWQTFLEACTQRLIGARDVTLQGLVLQTLMLCRELQHVVKPYYLVLEEALKDKGGAPSGLLRLVLGREEAERQLLDQPADAKQDVVLLPQHRAFMLPLIIRLLITKTQVKMGRSPGIVLANRRRIFSLLSSVDEAEIPMVLSVLSLRLLRLTARVSASAADASGKGLLASTPLEGMDKERALVEFIRWQHRRAQELGGAAADASAAAAAPAAPAAGAVGPKGDLSVEEPPVHVAISEQLLGSSSSTQLHGLLKSLQHLVQMQQHTLRPAAPFLVFLFGEILQQLVPTKVEGNAISPEVREMVTEDAEKPDAEEQKDEGELQTQQEAEATSELVTGERRGEATAAVNARHRKQCIRIAIDALQRLFSAFPDFVEAWKVLLAPAADALQLLLSAAVETGATGYSVDVKGGGKCPAIVRFVASWASNADYFVLYEQLLPKALPSLLGAIGSDPLLRFLQRSKRSSTPLLEVAIETALLLSFGGRTKEQQEEELRLSQREFNAMKHVNERRRRRRGYHSSSSEESDGDEQKGEGKFLEGDKAAILKSFREAYEALQKQQELQQQRGLQVLLPHLGILLHSMELLLNARRGAAAAIADQREEKSTKRQQQQTHSASETAASQLAEDPQQAFIRRRERFLLVGFKELQLLTRLAAYACEDKDPLLHQQQQPSHAESSAAEDPAVPTTAKLVRLLLLSLPLRVRSGGAAARQQLTLAAIQGLMPAVASWRRSVAASASSRVDMELRGLLQGLYGACCVLLESAEDLQCRAAAAEVLLSTELAACGSVLREGFVTSQIRGFAMKELNAYRQAEEEDGDGSNTASVSWLIPGGALCEDLLQSALPSVLDMSGRTAAVPVSSSKLAAAWRVSAALVMVCANMLKAGSRGTPEEQRPDVDMQVLVLLSVVENHLIPPALAYSPGVSEGEQQLPTAADEKKGDGEESKEPMQEQQKEAAEASPAETGLQGNGGEQSLQGKGEKTIALPQLHLPAFALEPIMLHVLYLLSDCSDDLTLQHVALTIIRKAAVALGAAASAAATRRTAVQLAAEQQQQQQQQRELPEEGLESDWGFAVAVQRLMIKFVVPHLHRLMRSVKEDTQRMALKALDALVRTLGPAGPLLPPPRAAATDEEAAAASTLFLSEADQQQRSMKLHLDLYPLLTATQLTPAVKEAAALAQQLVASGQAARAAAAAARAAQLEALAGEHQASGREAGGDVLLELLHMQKHRRSRGLQLLAKAAAAQRLCMNTVRHICLPLALWAILQENVAKDAAEKQTKGGKSSLTRKHRGRTEAFSQQMADQGIACLAQCCTRLPLKSCMQTLKQLVTYLTKVPHREAFIHRAIAATLKVFPFGLTDGGGQTKKGDTTDKQQLALAQGEKGKENKQVQEGGAAGASAHTAAELPKAAAAEEGASSEDETAGGEISKPAKSVLTAEVKRQRVESCIRDELIPMLYPLAFGSKVRRVASSAEAIDAPEPLEEKSKKTYENPVVRTELVAVLALLARMLPRSEFHLQLPRLVHSIAVALRSRERTARREARVAMVRLAVDLGPLYFTYLVTEVQGTLGPRSDKTPEADQQSFLRPVLLFTLHAMVNALLQQQPQQAAEAAAQLHASQDESSTGGIQFVQRFEAVVPVLLPLIAEEINRVADPDRLDQEESRRGLAGQLDGGEVGAPSSSTDFSTHSKVEEAQSLKGPSLLLLLTKESSPECLSDHLLPFVLGLLTGTSCKREGWSHAAAFSSKYINRAEDLLLHFVFGLNRNTKIPLEKKLRTAKQLLILTVATLQFTLLHPVLQAERGMSESLLLLSKQQLLLLSRKKRNKKPHNSSNSEPTKEGPANPDDRENTPETTAAAAQQREPEANRLNVSLSLSRSHQDDLQALRCLLLPDAKDEDTHPEDYQAGAPPPSQRPGGGATSSSRKLLISLLTTSKDRRFTLQPGAITGRSLEQATRSKQDPGKTGLELSTQASLLGAAALRLLHLSVKASKAPLKKFREKQLGLPQQQRPSSSKPEKIKERVLQGCMEQLDELALEVVCCFGCRSTKLVSWGARCLLELLSLRLPRLESKGALVAYLTMKIFHSCGSGSGVQGPDHYTARSELLPICTKLLAVLLLQPQAAKWMDIALNPSQHIGGDILRSLLREQLRALPWRYQDQLLQQRQQQQEKQQQQQKQQQGNGQSFVLSPQADLSFSASAAVTEEQLQAPRQFFLKEALLTHISSSLEDSQLQLCALFLFKRVVLQHYKDLVGEAARRAAEEAQQAAGTMSTEALQRRAQKKRQRDAKAAEAGEAAGGKQGTAAAELLPLVYECVDRVARVMVQHATFSAVSQKLSSICADVYVSFLLNFPMTPRLQQRRIFFLLQQQKFSDVYGRRAAIAALHKVVRRFPAELFMERYGQVALLTCCSTLATETDPTAHLLLQQVVREVLQLVEVADDPISRLHDQLKTVAKVFLVPRLQHLTALLELLTVFVPFLGGGIMAHKGGLLPSFLPKLLQLLCAVSYVAAGIDEAIDWRLLYKIILVYEQLLAAGGLPLMEEAFGKAAQMWRDAGPEALLTLTAAAAAAAADAPGETDSAILERQGVEALIANLNIWSPQPSNRLRGQKKAKSEQQHQQRQQIIAGLHAAQLWQYLVETGLHHENAWVRSAALRCVGQYLQQTPAALWHRSSATPLAFLAVGRRKETFKTNNVPEKETSPPLTRLGLALAQHFGRDSMLERHPSAAPCAIAALLNWAQIAYAFPHLVAVTRKMRNRTQANLHKREDEEEAAAAAARDNREDTTDQQLERGTEPTTFEQTEQKNERPSDAGIESTAAAATAAAAAGDSGASAAEGSDPSSDAAREKSNNNNEETAAADSAEADAAAAEGEAGEDDSVQEEMEPESPSAEIEAAREGEDQTDSGEAEESLLEEMQREAAKDGTEALLAAKKQQQQQAAALAVPKTSWTVFSRGSEEGENGKKREFSCEANQMQVHPLVFLVSGLSRWLRIHLGRLGFSGDSLPLSEGPPGTVARVSGIVAFFACLLKLLPLGELQHNAPDKPQTTAAATATATEAAGGVVHALLVHIADAVYRCSTLHTELAADSVLARIIENEGKGSNSTSTSTPGAPGSLDGGKNLWDALRGLSPVLQLGEVATGGAVVLRIMEQQLRSSGNEQAYSMLLASTRQNVSAKRVMRKLKAQQNFLENPRAHAKRKLRRNKAKEMQRKTRMREAIFRRKGFLKKKK